MCMTYFAVEMVAVGLPLVHRPEFVRYEDSNDDSSHRMIPALNPLCCFSARIFSTAIYSTSKSQSFLSAAMHASRAASRFTYLLFSILLYLPNPSIALPSCRANQPKESRTRFTSSLLTHTGSSTCSRVSSCLLCSVGASGVCALSRLWSQNPMHHAPLPPLSRHTGSSIFLSSLFFVRTRCHAFALCHHAAYAENIAIPSASAHSL